MLVGLKGASKSQPLMQSRIFGIMAARESAQFFEGKSKLSVSCVGVAPWYVPIDGYISPYSVSYPSVRLHGSGCGFRHFTQRKCHDSYLKRSQSDEVIDDFFWEGRPGKMTPGRPSDN